MRQNNCSGSGLFQHNLGVVDMFMCMYMHTLHIYTCIYTFFSMARHLLVGQGLLIIEASLSHSDTPQSIGFLWTSDQPFSGTSTWQHTTLTKDRHSKPQSQQAESGPQTQALDGAAAEIGSVCVCISSFVPILSFYPSVCTE